MLVLTGDCPSSMSFCFLFFSFSEALSIGVRGRLQRRRHFPTEGAIIRLVNRGEKKGWDGSRRLKKVRVSSRRLKDSSRRFETVEG
jgi:hypothetical protein